VVVFPAPRKPVRSNRGGGECGDVVTAAG